jgi:hypothetical protein
MRLAARNPGIYCIMHNVVPVIYGTQKSLDDTSSYPIITGISGKFLGIIFNGV